MRIIDSHAHCGILDRSSRQSFEDYLSRIAGSEIKGVVMFSPVMEIYDRHNPNFKDDPHWQRKRKRANEYLLRVHHKDLEVFPFFFIWNDFALEQLSPRHRGIKWHRHAFEPVYNYDDPRCARAVEEIRRRKMPVILEEELKNTVHFIREIGLGLKVVIPHMGALNGGYQSISEHELWELPDVFTDTSLASPYEILDYLEKYGHERIMFGSDFPFGDPIDELFKIQRLHLLHQEKRAILGLNLENLLGGQWRSRAEP